MKILQALGVDRRTIEKVVDEGILRPAVAPRRDSDPRAEPDVFDKFTTRASYGQLGTAVYVNGISADEVRQGQVGDCYFVAALAAVAAKRPDLLEKNLVANGDGTFDVTLHRPRHLDGLERLGWVGRNAEARLETGLELRACEPVTVRISEALPTYALSPVFARSAQRAEWPGLYEKAFAKMWGSYAAIYGGLPAQAMTALTGGTAGSFQFSSGDEAYARVTEAISKGQILCGATRLKQNAKDGIVADHCYSILDAREVDGEKQILIRNPWGEPERWISADQFAESFSRVDTCTV